jgi:exodeoxyribonuclease VII large subunit
MEAGGPLPRPDLVIVARGGGSIEDLWSFNEEIVVRAVAESSIPTISAVGHETDTTLCDYAADMRAPTPTAAAEMAVPVRAELLAMLTEQGLRIDRAVRRGAAQARERLTMQARLMPTPDMLLAPQRQRLDLLSDGLASGLRHRLADARAHLGQASGALRPALLRQYVSRAAERVDRLRLRPDYLERALRDRRAAFDSLSRLFASVNPDLPLQRGFARVMAGDRLVKSVADAQAAVAVSLHFRDGMVDATIGGAPLEKPSGEAISSSSRAPRKLREGQETGQQDLFS